MESTIQRRGSDFKNIVFTEATNTAKVHLVRHLQSLSSASRNRLIDLPIEGEAVGVVTDEFLNAQLATAGSKFNAAVNDVDELAEWVLEVMLRNVLRSEPQLEWVYNATTGEERLTHLFKVPSFERNMLKGFKPGEALGTVSVIPITDSNKHLVKTEMRGIGQLADQIMVNIIEGIEPPQTDNLIVVLKRKSPSDNPELHTAYTGILTPNLPIPGTLSAEEMHKCKIWWDRYAFVK